jgi:hypothetical protein
LADFLLGVFSLVGIEQAHVPPEYAARHYLTFTFPYSHGFLTLLLWGTIAGFLVTRLSSGRARVFWVVALLVVSHFFLDGLVHVAGLPLAGENSPKFGLGLWKHMPLELCLETLMALVGMAIYWKTAGAAASAVSRYGIVAFVVLLTALTWTQLWIITPPQPAQLTTTWLTAPIVFAGIVWVLDRKRVAILAQTS